MAELFVAWQWKANGGTTASNSAGSITSTVQANQDAGFNIVTYTGNGSNSNLHMAWVNNLIWLLLKIEIVLLIGVFGIKI